MFYWMLNTPPLTYFKLCLICRDVFRAMLNMKELFMELTVRIIDICQGPKQASHVHNQKWEINMICWNVQILQQNITINPFVPNADFLYPWKHKKTVPYQKTWRFSDFLSGYSNGTLACNWLSNKKEAHFII